MRKRKTPIPKKRKLSEKYHWPKHTRTKKARKFAATRKRMDSDHDFR